MRWKVERWKALIQLKRLKAMTRLITMDNPDAVPLYSDYIAYQCQMALYRLWNAEKNLPWEEFILAVRGSGKLCGIARSVAQNALLSFDVSQYDFELGERVLFFSEADEERGTIYAAPIFTKEEGEMFVHLFMLQTEIAHIYYLEQLRGLRYQWKQYWREIARDEIMRRKLVRAYQKALTDVDYEKSWISRSAHPHTQAGEPV